jgi:osmotically-inducible protein OsmY
MTSYEASSARSLLPDDAILADIWEAVEQVDTICSTDRNSLSIAVHAGAVVLEGHVTNTFNRRRVEEAARSVPGANAVRNDLVADDDLEIQVAQALAGDARTRPLILPVGSYHGWVRLGGMAPSRELQSAAEAVAASVPAVRGVIALPGVAGEPRTLQRRAVQPRPEARVYGEDGEVGRVAQVVINPQSRLVTHMVVSSTMVAAPYDISNLRRVTGDYLVPVEAAYVVHKDSVILTRPIKSLAAYPLCDNSLYPAAPVTWQPPYPYKLSTVRWFRPKTAEAARAAERQPAKTRPAAASSAELSSTLLSNAKERQQAAPQHA